MMRILNHGLMSILLGGLVGTSQAEDRKDVVIANAREHWLTWTATGEAFGKHHEGRSRTGRHTIGTLTSPEFELSRNYLNFHLGGGRSEKLRVELLVGGETIRTMQCRFQDAEIDPHGWDVKDLRGKKARLRLVDEETKGVEFIHVVRITLSDQPAPPIE